MCASEQPWWEGWEASPHTWQMRFVDVTWLVQGLRCSVLTLPTSDTETNNEQCNMSSPYPTPTLYSNSIPKRRLKEKVNYRILERNNCMFIYCAFGRGVLRHNLKRPVQLRKWDLCPFQTMGRTLPADWINCLASIHVESKNTKNEKCAHLCLDGQPQWLHDTPCRTLAPGASCYWTQHKSEFQIVASLSANLPLLQ